MDTPTILPDALLVPNFRVYSAIVRQALNRGLLPYEKELVRAGFNLGLPAAACVLELRDAQPAGAAP